MATPTIDNPPQRSARQLGDSSNSRAPAGSSTSGFIAAMNSAWAMLVRVIAVKNTAMLAPKNSAGGNTARQVVAEGSGRPVRSRENVTTVHHATTAPAIRQNAITEPVDSDHLISGELSEKLSTATTMARMPSGTGRRTVAAPSARADGVGVRLASVTAGYYGPDPTGIASGPAPLLAPFRARTTRRSDAAERDRSPLPAIPFSP